MPHLKRIEVMQPDNERYQEIIIGFDNDRYQAVRINKGDTPEQVARALHALTQNILHDEHLK